jgi:hypothetical protein
MVLRFDFHGTGSGPHLGHMALGQVSTSLHYCMSDLDSRLDDPALVEVTDER